MAEYAEEAKNKSLFLRASYSANAIKLSISKVNISLIEKSSAFASYKSFSCGDIIFYLKLKNDLIKNAKLNIRTMSEQLVRGPLTSLIIGKHEGGWKITKKDVLRELDKLPETQFAELAVNTLQMVLEKLGEKINDKCRRSS